MCFFLFVFKLKNVFALCLNYIVLSKNCSGLCKNCFVLCMNFFLVIVKTVFFLLCKNFFCFVKTVLCCVTRKPSFDRADVDLRMAVFYTSARISNNYWRKSNRKILQT